MALYAAPVHTGYKILTHTSRPLFAQNGFKQIGNTSVPANQITSNPVTASAIYNKNLKYAGAGSPRSSLLKGVSEAGYGRAYPNFGLAYSGAGSPRTSLLSDAYINDNPPPGSLRGIGRISIKGRAAPNQITRLSYAGAGSPRSSLAYAGAGSPRGSFLRGLRDTPVDSAGDQNLQLPTITTTQPITPYTDTELAAAGANTSSGDTGILSNIGSDVASAFGSLFGTAVTATTAAASTAVSRDITGAINPPSPTAQAITAVKTATNPKTILGVSVDTALIAGAALAAYFYFKK